MTIGILTQPKSYTRKYLFKRLLKLCTYELISDDANPFDIYAEILPYQNKNLEKMTAFQLEKLINKSLISLKNRGIANVILSKYLYGLCQAKGVSTCAFANGIGKKIFLKLMPLCVRQITKKSGINLFTSNICISDSKMDRISEYLMRELCFDTKKLYLCTQNLKSANAFCESFYDETGLWINVCDRLSFYCDVILDVDNCQIKVGHDLFVRNADFGYNFYGYDICQTDTAAFISSPDLTRISWVYSYEK